MPYWYTPKAERSPELGWQVLAGMGRRALLWLTVIGVIVVGGWIFG